MSGAIMNKVWGFLGMDPARDNDEEEVENYDEEEVTREEDEEVEEKKLWGRNRSRVVDVVSGAVHALDGHIQKISNAIFLIAPYNYDIASDMVARDEIKNKLSVSWLRNGNNN